MATRGGDTRFGVWIFGHKGKVDILLQQGGKHTKKEMKAVVVVEGLAKIGYLYGRRLTANSILRNNVVSPIQTNHKLYLSEKEERKIKENDEDIKTRERVHKKKKKER